MIKKVSLVDQVYSQLRDEIISLKRAPGSKINVNELQNTMDVSVTPIREAVNRLQQEGLVNYENNVGARVMSLNSDDIIEIQQLALALHVEAIYLAMVKADQQELQQQLTDVLERYKASQTPEDEARAVFDFVAVFYRASGNGRLVHTMETVQGQQLILRHLYAGMSKERAVNAHYFEKILEAVKEHDVLGAQNGLRNHANGMTEALIAAMEAGTLL